MLKKCCVLDCCIKGNDYTCEQVNLRKYFQSHYTSISQVSGIGSIIEFAKTPVCAAIL